MFVNVDGCLVPEREARIPVFDHGALYGDGLFETLRVYPEGFFRLEAHLLRLEDGAVRLGIALPWSRETLAGAIRATVVAAGLREGAVRLTVTRGEGPPVPDPAVCARPRFLVTLRPWSTRAPEAFERGVRVAIVGTHPRTWVPGIKSLSFLPFQQARQAARTRGADEALLTDGERVVEASLSNVFAVHRGVLVTPDLESGCLPGITRAAVLEVARAAGIPTLEAPLYRSRVVDADEIFLTNSIQEVLPVVALDGAPVGEGVPGPITRLLADRYRILVRREARPIER